MYTIRRTHKIGNALTDFTNLKLSSPGAAEGGADPRFGLRTYPGGVVIVADDVDFVHDSIGQYHYSVDLAAGQYEYWVERTYGGETKWDYKLITVGAVVGGYVPYWTTQEEVESYYRADQTNLWTGGSSGAPIQAQWDRALRSTDRRFDKAVRDAGYTLPFPTDSVDFPYLSELATIWCGVELYWVTGGLRDMDRVMPNDSVGRAAGTMKGHHDHVLGELTRMSIFGIVGSNTRSNVIAADTLRR
jgi:hypothetical protein